MPGWICRCIDLAFCLKLELNVFEESFFFFFLIREMGVCTQECRHTPRPVGGVRFLGAGITGGLYECWEVNLGPLQKQYALTLGC